MSEIHQFKCDKCKTRANAYYNGEHYLHPEGWYQLYCNILARTVDLHLCPKCAPTKPKKA